MRPAGVACAAAGIDRLSAFAQLPAHFEYPVDQRFFFGPARLQRDQARVVSARQFLVDTAAPRCDVDADRCFALDDLALSLQRFDAALAILDFGRRRVLADRHPRAARCRAG